MNFIESAKDIQYVKLLIAFFCHLFPAALFASFTSIWLKDQGIAETLCILIQIAIMIYIIHEGYKEEVLRHYPFIKMIGVNLLTIVLFLIIVFTKIYILVFPAIFLLVKAIHYKGKNCIEYKRPDIDAD